MKTRSIRWQLPFSYAAIAFLAALSLGAVLLTILHNHYTNQERDYLRNQAQNYAMLAGIMFERGASSEELDRFVSQWGFLSDTRIVLTDTDNQVLADSGVPERFYFEVAPTVVGIGSEQGALSFGLSSRDYLLATRGKPAGEITSVEPSGNADVVFHEYVPGSPPEAQVFTINVAPASWRPAEEARYIPVSRSPYGLRFGPAADATRGNPRSDQMVRTRILGRDGKTIFGALQISDGPAYGREILNSVAQGWMFAGGFSVGLAALVGWFVSSRLTSPLVSLTEATTRMSQGDLSVRTAIARRDELGSLAKSFNEMADRIEHTVVTLRRFAADAAHELHTPLTALRTNLELVRETHNSPAAQRALEQVHRMEALADDLLNLSRIETHVDSTAYESLDLVQIATEIGAIYASRAEQADLDFELEIPDRLPVVKGNPVQVQRMLCNVLDNAVKFTPTGGSIHMCVRNGDRQVEIRVQDTGIGIPQEDLPFLFERFRRGRNTANYPGSGLGLAMVKAIVDAHGGSVVVESSAAGTCIATRLPIAAS